MADVSIEKIEKILQEHSENPKEIIKEVYKRAQGRDSLDSSEVTEILREFLGEQWVKIFFTTILEERKK